VRAGAGEIDRELQFRIGDGRRAEVRTIVRQRLHITGTAETRHRRVKIPLMARTRRRIGVKIFGFDNRHAPRFRDQLRARHIAPEKDDRQSQRQSGAM
jgi:hypothetical protein